MSNGVAGPYPFGMRRIGIVLLYVAVLAGGTYSGFRPTFDSGFARVQAEAGDGMLNHYLLEHSWQVVSNPNYCGTLLSPPFFYPQPLTLAYSESFLGVAPLYWGFRLAFPDDLAYQWWMILCSVLNFLAFAAVVRWFGCGHLLAAFGGFFWAFALVHLEQAKHQQMIPRFWMPLAVYHAWCLANVPTVRSLNRCLGCLFLQAASCVYSGWFLGVGLMVFFPIAVMGAQGGWRGLVLFFRTHPLAVVRVVGLWVIALGCFFTPYVLANRGFSRGYVDCIDLIPTLAAWLTGPPESRWSGTLRPYLRGVSEENRLFSGFGPDILFVIAGGHMWLTRRNHTRQASRALVGVCLITATVWWLLTMSDGEGISGWWLVRFVPGGSAIRCVSRVYTIVYLFGTFGVIIWLEAVSQRFASRCLQLSFILAVSLPVVVEQTGFQPPAMNKSDFYPNVDRCAVGLRGADIGYMIPDPGRPQLYGDVVAMWAGLRANVPVVNGYSGRYPDAYPLVSPGETPEVALRKWLSGRFRGRIALIDPEHPEQAKLESID